MRGSALVLMAVALAGCVTPGPFRRTNYTLGEVKSATVGSEIVSVTEGVIDGFTRKGYRQDLLYGGVANGIVKVSYREFMLKEGSFDPIEPNSPEGVFARPAFTQELQYDLNDSKMIAFRTLRVEVLSAANDKITYRVVEGPLPVEPVRSPNSPGQGQSCSSNSECTGRYMSCEYGRCVPYQFR